MRHFFLGVLCALAVLAIAAWGYVRFGFAEVRGDLPVSGVENSLMHAGVRASIRREAPEVANPIARTDETLIKGGKYYVSVRDVTALLASLWLTRDPFDSRAA
jgi:hypothetical protein